MIQRRAFAGLLLVLITVTLPAQTRRRAFIPATDDLTILQTTDLHDHANGAAHVGLDVDPATGTSVLGAYSRISAYVSYVRSSAGHPVLLRGRGGRSLECPIPPSPPREDGWW